MLKRRISPAEYRRRVFNTALLECLNKIHGEVLNGAVEECDDCTCNAHISTMAEKMAKGFFQSMIGLENNTIDKTKARLKDSTDFIHDCMDICESIACDKANCATKEELEIPEDQKIELSKEDEFLIDKVFDEKNPKLQVDTIRDATVKALVAEDQKAQEIKDAVNMAAESGENKSIEETINRIAAKGPTSLMNAIINNVTAAAIRDVNENAGVKSIGDVMSANKDEIKTRAVMIYSLYEMASVFGIEKYNTRDVKRLAEEIYYGK